LGLIPLLHFSLLALIILSHLKVNFSMSAGIIKGTIGSDGTIAMAKIPIPGPSNFELFIAKNQILS